MKKTLFSRLDAVRGSSFMFLITWLIPFMLKGYSIYELNNDSYIVYNNIIKIVIFIPIFVSFFVFFHNKKILWHYILLMLNILFAIQFIPEIYYNKIIIDQEYISIYNINMFRLNVQELDYKEIASISINKEKVGRDVNSFWIINKNDNTLMKINLSIMIIDNESFITQKIKEHGVSINYLIK